MPRAASPKTAGKTTRKKTTRKDPSVRKSTRRKKKEPEVAPSEVAEAEIADSGIVEVETPDVEEVETPEVEVEVEEEYVARDDDAVVEDPVSEWGQDYRDELRALIQNVGGTVEKRHGANTVQIAADVEALERPKWSSGIIPLDVALSGGWEAGKLHVVYGDPSSAKTYTLLRTIATIQRSCSRCCHPLEFCTCSERPRRPVVSLIVSENDWDPVWATTIGVDIDNLVFAAAETGEKGVDVSDVLVRTGQVDLIVIDSLALLVPQAEIDLAAGDAAVALQARLITRAMRKFVSGMTACRVGNTRLPTILCSNQTRLEIGAYGNPEILVGGRLAQYSACTEIRMRKVKYPSTRATNGEGKAKSVFEYAEFAQASFDVRKNKTSRPGGKGEFQIRFYPTTTKEKGDVVDEAWIWNKAYKYGLFRRTTEGWLCVGREVNGVKEDVIRMLETDPTFKWMVREALIRVLN